MKKHALDIAIVVCAIIVIVLAVILVWPTDKKDLSKSTKVKNEVNSEEKVNEETKEVSNNEETRTEDEIKENSFLADTAVASNEDEVVSYVADVESQISTKKS